MQKSVNKFFMYGTALLFLTTVLLSGSLSWSKTAPSERDILHQTAQAFSQIAKQAKPAVVHISVESTTTASTNYEQFFNHPFFEQFFGPQFRNQPRPKRQQRGTGSGFIISPDGYILTNNHVVENADKITVTLADNQQVEARIIGTDPLSDVALIKIDRDEKLPTIPLGNSERLEVGEWVIAIGNPFGLNQTVTVGVVSATGRSRVGINEYENFIQTDAAINPGNSGGPLLNIEGAVVGINSALYSRTGGYMGIGFAIPIDMVKSIEDQLQKHGKVTRGWLGVAIQDIDENLAESFGLKSPEGILISEVTPDSPAQKAGLQQGDVITELNNIRLKDVTDLRNKIALTVPSSVVDLTVIRDGKTTAIGVTIGEQPADFGNVAGRVPTNTMLSDYGITVQELTDDLAEQFGYTGRQGIVVSEVAPDSAAARSGLEPGQLIEEVNKEKVSNFRELKAALTRGSEPDRVLLRIRSGNFSQYVVLRKN